MSEPAMVPVTFCENCFQKTGLLAGSTEWENLLVYVARPGCLQTLYKREWVAVKESVILF